MVASRGAIVVGDADRRARAHAVAPLRRAGYETIEAGTGLETLAATGESEVGLVLLEIVFPDMTGYEVCGEFRAERGEALPIFFLTATRTEPLDRVAGLMIGADDFIVKPFDADELVARVRRFLTRAAAVRDAGVKEFRVLRPAASERLAAPGNEAGQLPHLTEREQQVLDLLAHGQRQKQIARELSISEKTVATHIQNLLGKFQLHSRAELVAHAYVAGIVASPIGDAGRRRRGNGKDVTPPDEAYVAQ